MPVPELTHYSLIKLILGLTWQAMQPDLWTNTLRTHSLSLTSFILHLLGVGKQLKLRIIISYPGKNENKDQSWALTMPNKITRQLSICHSMSDFSEMLEQSKKKVVFFSSSKNGQIKVLGG